MRRGRDLGGGWLDIGRLLYPDGLKKTMIRDSRTFLPQKWGILLFAMNIFEIFWDIIDA